MICKVHCKIKMQIPSFSKSYTQYYDMIQKSVS